jgi:hypothetical protein
MFFSKYSGIGGRLAWFPRSTLHHSRLTNAHPIEKNPELQAYLRFFNTRPAHTILPNQASHEHVFDGEQLNQ